MLGLFEEEKLYMWRFHHLVDMSMCHLTAPYNSQVSTVITVAIIPLFLQQDKLRHRELEPFPKVTVNTWSSLDYNSGVGL